MPRLPTTARVPLVLGVLFTGAALWRLATEGTADATLVAGLSCLLFGIGQNLGNRTLVVVAYVLPGAAMVVTMLAIAAAPDTDLSTAGRAVLVGAALLGVALLALLVVANREPSGRRPVTRR